MKIYNDNFDTFDTFDKIRKWAKDKNITQGSSPQAQMLKLTEEVGELAAAIARNEQGKIIDSIGDCIVVLTILTAHYGLYVEDAVDAAYEEIKDRKGKLVDGIFIKEE
jgi:NTP pyrophosphatase (non-canonical NTP hydrolase)